MSVAVYMRVSSEEQRERQSILTQREALERYCRERQVHVVDWYADDGVSGSLGFGDRPEAKRLLEDAALRRFETVIVYMYDRFSRDVFHGLEAFRTLARLGVTIVSIQEPYDVQTPTGEYMFIQSLNNAQLWKRQHLERCSDGSNRCARQGVWLGGIVPFGYRVEGLKKDARLTIAEELIPGTELSEADVIRRIFHWLADDGRSCIWIAEELTRMGIPPSYVRDEREVQRSKRKSRTSGIWRPSRIRNMVVSPTYKGVHVYGKRNPKKKDGMTSARRAELIERPVPAIVTPELWDAAQRTLSANQILSHKNTKRRYLMRGLIKCGTCGLTYVGTSYTLSDGGQKAYYQCNGKASARGIYGQRHERCPSKSISAYAEYLVWKDIEGFLRNPGAVLEQLAERRSEQAVQAEDYSATANRLQAMIDGKDNEKSSVVALYRRGRIDAGTLDRQLDEIEAELQSLRRELADTQSRSRESELLGSRVETTASLLQELNSRLDSTLSWETKRQVVEALVKRASVDAEGRLHVEYCFENTSAVNCTVRGSSPPPA